MSVFMAEREEQEQKKVRALDPEEVGIRVGVSARQARELLYHGIIPKGYKVGGRWRIDEPDLEEHLDNQKAESARTLEERKQREE